MDVDRREDDGGEAVGFEGGHGVDYGRSADAGDKVCSSGESSFGVAIVKEEVSCLGSEVKDEGNGNDPCGDEGGRSSSICDHENSSHSDRCKVEKVEFAMESPIDSKDCPLETQRIIDELNLPKIDQEVQPSKSSSMQYKSLMSEFDEYVANEKHGLIENGVSRALSYGFEVGDLVWGKVKSHPWWPGHIFNDALATSSVRRTSRTGHVLVAFFGDSSYGWFDPAELIPFDANFAEKSRQTNARTFVKAVEEAIDEISRRSALGLACKCRNKYNFRPTSIQGYFAVDVPDYEHGVYCETQIKKARDSFVPRETLAFIQQLASAPQGSDQMNLDFIKNKAAAFAYRKAVFEEFDETYAQAFGMPAARTSHDTSATDQPVREQSRAPLSGPLVIAETLGGSKNSSKLLKVKDQSKKDKYLFKRRDDSVPGASSGDSDVSAGYVLQKRVPSVSLDSQSLAKMEQDRSTDAIARQDTTDEAALMDGTPAYRSSSLTDGDSESSTRVLLQDGQEKKSNIPGLDQVQGSGTPVNSSLTVVKRTIVRADGVAIKKKKAVKQPRGELSMESDHGKKKKRKVLGPGQSSDQQQDRMVTGKAVRVVASGKDVGSSSVLDSSGSLTVGGTGKASFELKDLLNGLHHLAVDHLRGVERIGRPIIKKSFLRFRSLVYQKSLIITPASESDYVEIRPAKSSAKALKEPSNEADRKSVHPKPIKASLRPDDPSRGGRKRPSDHQDNLEAKKVKSMGKLKLIALGKRAVEKGEGKESASVGPSSKPAKSGLARRVELMLRAPPKAAEPTMLVMKFPPETSLPSVAHLKARFARFGPLDHNSLRVFWKSSTCRVVFQHKVDAEAACKFAMGNNSPFGNVRCHVRPVELPGSEGPETNEDSMIETPGRPKDLNPKRQVATPHPYQPVLQQQSVRLKSCLKKPPGEEEGLTTTSGNGGRGTARVKFLLGGEGDPKQDQPGIGNTNSNNSTNSGNYGTASSSSTTTSSVGGTMYNSKNFQQKSSLPPLLPTPSPYAIAQHQQHNNSSHHYPEIPMRNQPPGLPSSIATAALPSQTATALPGVDISQQMISLLTRCNDVVTSLTGVLGYVPYHPL